MNEVIRMNGADNFQYATKAALFVDFDNIYLSLRETDPAAAQHFAQYPARWLAWIEQGMPTNDKPSSGRLRRRLNLIRRCYLNPMSFLQYYSHFARAGFSIIGCPVLTQKGKNSSDIHMVVDILTSLDHKTPFEEFIIFSGDSDFTPVLLQLRAYNRRTIIITTGPTARAYKSAADHVITEDVFIEDALGLSVYQELGVPPKKVASPSNTPHDALDLMAERVFEELRSKGQIPGMSLVEIFKSFPEFKNQNNWMGFGSLKGLVEELVRRKREMYLIEGPNWRVVLKSSGLTAPDQSFDHASKEVSSYPVNPARPVENDLKKEIIKVVREIAMSLDEPIGLAKLASQVIRTLGVQVTETQWAGMGSFRSLLERSDINGFKVVVGNNHSGYLYDPSKHILPAGCSTDQCITS